MDSVFGYRAIHWAGTIVGRWTERASGINTGGSGLPN
jgi:hypothetical protein